MNEALSADDLGQRARFHLIVQAAADRMAWHTATDAFDPTVSEESLLEALGHTQLAIRWLHLSRQQMEVGGNVASEEFWQRGISSLFEGSGDLDVCRQMLDSWAAASADEGTALAFIERRVADRYETRRRVLELRDAAGTSGVCVLDPDDFAFRSRMVAAIDNEPSDIVLWPTEEGDDDRLLAYLWMEEAGLDHAYWVARHMQATEPIARPHVLRVMVEQLRRNRDGMRHAAELLRDGRRADCVATYAASMRAWLDSPAWESAVSEPVMVWGIAGLSGSRQPYISQARDGAADLERRTTMAERTPRAWR